MTDNNDIVIKAPVPFLNERTVLFVDDPACSFGSLIATNRERLDLHFRKMRHRFVFIPEMLQSLTPELLGYQFPGLTEPLTAESIYTHIRAAAGLGSEAGFLYKADNAVRFCRISDFTDEAVSEALGRMTFLRYTNKCSNTNESSRRTTRGLRSDSILFPETEDVDNSINFSLVGKEEKRYCEESAPHRFPFPPEVPLDAKTLAILEAWRRFEEEYGISIRDLEKILGYNVKLSRLHIARSGEIRLTDYNDKTVKLDDLTKSVFFFYLKHPEGARLKELQEHKTEILRIYESITGRDDIEGIKKSVSTLLDPYANGMNVSLSRIKKAFRDIVGDRIAEHYYISGSAGDVRRITLDRDLVIWED